MTVTLKVMPTTIALRKRSSTSCANFMVWMLPVVESCLLDSRQDQVVVPPVRLPVKLHKPGQIVGVLDALLPPTVKLNLMD